MVEVEGTDEFEDWYMKLDDGEEGPDSRAVARAIERLARVGVTLDHPYSSALRGSRHPLRELRIQSQGRPLRVAYAFDPKRQAILLLGGDKTGDDRFYTWFIPHAERLWEGYLEEIGS